MEQKKAQSSLRVMADNITMLHCCVSEIFILIFQEYLPVSLERRQNVLERKRLDYWNLVKQYYETERDEGFQDTYRQIHIDIPRMSPLISLFQQVTVQMIFERILYIWAIRHPASGYVQVLFDFMLVL